MNISSLLTSITINIGIQIREWLRNGFALTEEEILASAGLDAVVFLRIFTFSLKLLVFMMGMGFVVLIPINLSDSYLKQASLQIANFVYSELDSVTLANISPKSPRMWAHLFTIYAISSFICHQLWKEQVYIKDLRGSLFANTGKAPEHFTVLVMQIPKSKTLTVDNQVREFFKLLHPATYLEHHVVYKADSCSSLLKKRADKANKLQRALKKYHITKQRPWHTKGLLSGLYGEQIDSIDSYCEELEELNEAYEKERQRVLAMQETVKPAAFVSFTCRWGATVAAQSLPTENPSIWVVKQAPEPRDIFWPNLAIPHIQLSLRSLAMSTASLTLCCFYMVPVSLVQSLTEINTLSKLGPLAKHIVHAPGISQFVTGFLPGLILKLCLLLLPSILYFFATIEGHVTFSKLQREASSRYFYFLILNGFLGSVLTGSVLQQLNAFISRPKNIPALLGATIPAKATFFMTLCMVDGWGGLAWEILRPLSLVFSNARSGMLTTERDRRAAMDPGGVPYIQVVPKLMFYLMLSMTYATISPLLVPFVIIYFLLGYVVWRNQILNVYEPLFDSKGRSWPFVHCRVIASMIIMQLTLLGVFILKSATIQTLFLIPLPLATLFFHKFCAERFHPPYDNYSLEDAAIQDELDKGSDVGADMTFLESAYLHPALKSMDLDIDSIGLHHIPQAPQLGDSTLKESTQQFRSLDKMSSFLDTRGVSSEGDCSADEVIARRLESREILLRKFSNSL